MVIFMSVSVALFRNKRLVFDEMMQENVSKYVIFQFLEYEETFHFSFRPTLFFPSEEMKKVQLGLIDSKSMKNFIA